MRIDEDEFFAIGMNLMGEMIPIRFHTKSYSDAINIARMFCGKYPEKHLFIITEDGPTLAYNRYRKYIRSREN